MKYTKEQLMRLVFLAPPDFGIIQIKVCDEAYTRLYAGVPLEECDLPLNSKPGIIKYGVEDEHGYIFYNVLWADGTESVSIPLKNLYFPRFLESKSINAIAKTHYEWVDEMGWHGKATPLESLALVASEVGEAVNECRYEKPTDKLGSELADIILRVLDLSIVLDINIETEILNKIEANKKRGNKGRII